MGGLQKEMAKRTPRNADTPKAPKGTSKKESIGALGFQKEMGRSP